MRILVTGGAGFIGSAVRRHLDTVGWDMVSFDSPYDVCNPRDVYDAVASVDGVIHLAGILGTEETIDRPDELVGVNILGALNVMHAAHEADIPLVQIGTGHRGQLNTYAITKACAEDLALMRARYRGQKVNVVRAFHAYGPGQKAPAPYGAATVRKIIPAFVCAALAGDPLMVNGTGRQIIDLVHVDDVARCLVEALEAPYGRLIEAGTGTGVSVFDAACDVIQECRSASQVQHQAMRDGEPEFSQVVAATGLPYARPWPGGLDEETIGYYARLLEAAA
jgi:UDP-glucose 4-epimerase